MTEPMEVTESDLEFAVQIVADFAEFEEGITDEDKMAEWVRNVRRAAIKSLREPTEAMIDAGYEVCGSTGDASDIPAAWRAMIDVVLQRS